MKPIAIIAIIAAVVVVGGACAGVAFSGVLNGGTNGPGGDDPVVPTDPVDPTPTETPTETPTPTPTDSSMSYFSPMTSSGSSSSGSSTPAHIHAWDGGVVTTEPTCEGEGVKTFTCSDCQETKTEVVPATSHTWDEGIVTTTPTCEDEGVKTFTCSDCQETKTEAIPATGHAYQPVTLKTIDTGTSIGVRYICSVCDDIGKDIITEAVAATIGTDYFENIDNALTEAGAEDVVNVKAGAGEYTLPTQLSDKVVIFSGTKDTVINTTKSMPSTNSADLTFDGVTIHWSTANTGYQGFKHIKKVVYNNCIINGTQFMYGDAEFKGCTFNSDDSYCVWTYGNNVTFTDCIFNTGGRAVLVYNEYEVHATVTLTNCEFSDDGTYADPKAAVEVGSSPYSTDTTYEIIINGCTAKGFEINNSNSPLWGNKNSMDTDHLNVIVDGVDVY